MSFKEDFDYEIDKTVAECDSAREKLEGVGLSDTLVQLVRLAFTQGVVFGSTQAMKVTSAALQEKI